MGAWRGVEADVTRLFEGTGKVGGLQDWPEEGGGVAGIGTQIAVAQIGCGEECRSTRQIKNDIAARSRIIARWPEQQCVARGRRSLREIVDHHLERAEIASGVSDFSLRNRKIDYSGRYDRSGRLDQYAHVELILDQVPPFDPRFLATPH